MHQSGCVVKAPGVNVAPNAGGFSWYETKAGWLGSKQLRRGQKCRRRQCGAGKGSQTRIPADSELAEWPPLMYGCLLASGWPLVTVRTGAVVAAIAATTHSALNIRRMDNLLGMGNVAHPTPNRTAEDCSLVPV